jgi:hypothetical protein
MDWYTISITFRWPHQGMILGFELLNSPDEDLYNLMRFHFLLVTLNFEFGYEDDVFK